MAADVESIAVSYMHGWGDASLVGPIGKSVVGDVIGIKGNAYCEAAHAIGSPSWRTLLRHVWPNIAIGWAIVAGASLSFPGFGLPPEVPSWGGMLSREGRQYLTIAPRLAIWPWLVPDHCGVRHQHVRRRHARPGSAAAGRWRPEGGA